MRIAHAVPVLTLPFLAFVCREQYRRAPVVHNTLERSIQLYVLYENGQSFSAEFPPDARGFSPVEGIAIDESEVQIEGKVLFRLEKEESTRLRSSLPPGTRVMWEIHGDGVTAVIAPD